MNILHKLIFGGVALAGFALATPVQAHDDHHHSYYRGHSYGYHHGYDNHGYYYGGPSVVFGGPYYDPYYYDYPVYPAYGYRAYGPGVTFAFGGHGGYYHHGHYHHHH